MPRGGRPSTEHLHQIVVILAATVAMKLMG